MTDTKNRILSSAIALFSERGFSAVSMREIAKAVGISAPALYNHYANKEALYQAAVSETFADRASGLLDALHTDEKPILRLQHFVSIVTLAVREDPHFRILMQRELLDGDASRLSFIARQVFTPIQRPLMDLLQELRPDCDAFLFTELIFGMLTQHDQMQQMHPFLQHPTPSERSPKAIADLVMQVLTPYFTGAS